MGLMVSILIGCVGAMELLACLRRASDGLLITIDQPATPCLSYHEPTNDNASMTDSICSFSHSSEARLPRSAKRKLENLHEYSLRIRAELRSLGRNFDCGTLSDCSTRDLLRSSRCTPDSRLSPDLDYLVQASESREDQGEVENDRRDRYERETSYEDAAENWRIESSSRDRPLSVMNVEPEKYVRVPTPIPFNAEDGYSSSGASSDVGTSFDNDSGNEAPTTKSFDSIPIIKRRKSPSEGGSSVEESDSTEKRKPTKRFFRKSHSRSPEPSKLRDRVPLATELARSLENGQEIDAATRAENLDASRERTSQRKRTIKSSSTIVRKPARLKSRNAEMSKSAESLSARKSKRRRDPERRKSEISIRTGSTFSKDEGTNTSPQGSPVAPLSRTDSRRSVSVQVQTSFEEESPKTVEAPTELEGSAVGLSEGRRDLSSRDRFGRRTFKNRKFGSGSRDKANIDDVDADGSRDSCSVTNATASLVRSKDEARLLKISSFEEADEEDYERIRRILSDTDSRESNARRKTESKSVSSFEDDEYWDAEDVSAATGPILYSIPDPDRSKAFWVMMQINEAPPVSLRVHPFFFLTRTLGQCYTIDPAP